MKQYKVKINNSAQVWVETVVYTLIGLTILGVVLSLVQPVIEEKKDAASVSQNIDLLNTIDKQIEDIRYVAGNSRLMSVKIGRGEIIVDGEKDTVGVLVKDTRYAYSQPGINVSVDRINALTTQKGKRYEIRLTLNYSGKLNITYKGRDVLHSFLQAPTPYAVSIGNNGIRGNYTNIDFSY
jgi:type II secretory pathway pseudopilin PulG